MSTFAVLRIHELNLKYIMRKLRLTASKYVRVEMRQFPKESLRSPLSALTDSWLA